MFVLLFVQFGLLDCAVIMRLLLDKLNNERLAEYCRTSTGWHLEFGPLCGSRIYPVNRGPIWARMSQRQSDEASNRIWPTPHSHRKGLTNMQLTCTCYLAVTVNCWEECHLFVTATGMHVSPQPIAIATTTWLIFHHDVARREVRVHDARAPRVQVDQRLRGFGKELMASYVQVVVGVPS